MKSRAQRCSLRVHSLIRMNKHLEQPPSHEVGEVYDSDEEPYDDDCQMDLKDLAPEGSSSYRPPESVAGSR